MEIYLQNSSNILRLPIIPSSIKMSEGIVSISENIHNSGDINLFGGKGLAECEFSTFFPYQKYSFANYQSYKKPITYVKMIRKWMRTGTKIRFIITTMNVNKIMLITKFDFEKNDGTGDIYYTISLKEYREVKKSKDNTADTVARESSIVGDSTKDLINDKITVYKVKKGDTLITISKKFYKDTKHVTTIKNKNKKKYPSLAKSNKLKVGWILTI